MNPTGNYPIEWLPPSRGVIHWEVTIINGSPSGPEHYELTIPTRPVA